MKRLLMTAALLLPLSAAAQEPFINGVYLESPELCQQAVSQGLQTVIEASAVLLTARGLDAIEHNCRFLDVTARAGGGAWLAEAFCEEPGLAYPELFAIIEREPGRLEITSTRARSPSGQGEGMPSEPLSYSFCEGVEPP